MNLEHTLLLIIVMAAVTYLVRMLPMIIFKKKITNKFVKSFLHYMPYAVLSAMTFPAIFTSTATIYSAIAGTIVAILLALKEKSLLTVAISACMTVYLAELIIRMI